LRAPEIQSKLVDMGHDPVGLCGPEFSALVRRQYDDYGRVIREAHIMAE
jgi:tripartite-type tricarboxylate transporter receptor subunit TctC